MLTDSLKTRYLQRKLPILKEKLIRIEKKLLKEYGESDKKGMMQQAKELLDKSFPMISEKGFESIDDAIKKYQTEITQTKNKPKELAKTYVKGLMLLNVLESGFDEIGKILESAKIALSDESLKEKTLSMALTNEEESNDNEDDLEEVSDEAVEEAKRITKEIVKAFEPTGDYAPLKDLGEKVKIFDLAKFTTELMDVKIGTIEALRKVVSSLPSSNLIKINEFGTSKKKGGGGDPRNVLNTLMRNNGGDLGKLLEALGLNKESREQGKRLFSFIEKLEDNDCRSINAIDARNALSGIIKKLDSNNISDLERKNKIPQESIRKLIDMLLKAKYFTS